MATDEHSGSVDPEIARLQQKSDEGLANIATNILKQPKVLRLIKTAVLRETFTSGLVMACFFLGLMMLYNVAKTVVGFGWIGDLLIGIVLIGVGLIYIRKNILLAKKNGN